MNKEYTYDIGKYTIGVDENSENGIGLTVAMIENNEIKFLGNCYGDNARCIDLLIRENQELKRQLEVGEEQYNDLVEEKEKLEQENQELKKTIEIMGKYFELIIDFGFDYDGLNDIQSLKSLIDEIVRFARLGRVANITEPIFSNGQDNFNVLGERIEKSDK